MTHAVLIVLISLAIVLFVHVIFLLVLLKSKSKGNSNQNHDQILIVHASQSGQSENYALQTAQQLSASGQTVQTISIENFNAETFKQHAKILWMVSTYGEGDAPDSARKFIQNIMTKSFELNDVQYAVLAFGDRHYSNFCEFGRRLDRWLADNHAQALFPMICVDQLSQTDLAEWQIRLSHALQQSLPNDIVIEQHAFHPVVLSERHLLNQGSLGNLMYHLVLKQVDGLNWQSGDILEIQCANTDTQINTFLTQFNLFENEVFQSAKVLDVLRFKNLRTFDSEQNFDEWLLKAQDLPIREYSIASIPSQQQLELVVRQEVLEHGLGLGSGYLTKSLALGDSLLCRVRANPAFHLAQIDQAMIFIGNGSGIAGLMSHIRQREVLQYHRNWLIYGERQRAVDLGFEKQLNLWQQQGVLAEIDLAFSRDQQVQNQNAPKYVQDCLIAKSEQVKAWIEQGAAIYICGSLQGMAQGVESALIQILGKAQFEQLIEQKRYLRDVY